jgi:hypothetical protein
MKAPKSSDYPPASKDLVWLDNVEDGAGAQSASPSDWQSLRLIHVHPAKLVGYINR